MVVKKDIYPLAIKWSMESILSKLQHNRSLAGIANAMVARNVVCQQIFDHFAPQVPMGEPVACREGCSYCCHAVIQARPLESIFAAIHAQLTLPQDVVQAIQQRVLSQRRPCPFLVNERCSIYEARLGVCHFYYSFRFSDCQEENYCERTFKFADKKAVRHREHLNAIIYNAANIGTDKAMDVMGLQNAAMNLDNVLRVIYTQPEAIQRWLDGETVFD